MKNVHSTLTKTSSGWTATDHYDIGNSRQLQITTYKHFDKILRTTAMVGRVEKHDGYSSFCYTLGVGRPGDGDFYKRLVASDERATEKSVAKIHAASLELLDDVMLLVKAHYGDKLDEVSDV